MLRVALVSPVPAQSDQLPESGVAAYTASLVSALPTSVDVTILAQATAHSGTIGPARILPTWTPDRRVARQVPRAIEASAPDLAHVQHEFNLYGGLLQGA